MWFRSAGILLIFALLMTLSVFGFGQQSKSSRTTAKKSAASVQKERERDGKNGAKHRLLDPEEAEERAEANLSKKGKSKSQANLGPTNPMEAMNWRMLAWRDSNGQIDPDGYPRALAQMRKLQEDKRFAPSAYRWIERGPDNIAGRTRSLIIDPRDPNRMFTGAVGGGIWKTTNGGGSWSVVDDKLSSLAVTCLTFDPNNNDIIYAGTGEGYYNIDAVGGAGIYRSKDNGLTWAQLPATKAWRYTNRIAVAPGNSNLILVANRSGGISRSTDGGATFTTVLSVQAGMQVAFSPNGSRALAAVLDYDFNVGTYFSKLFYSTDGGATWTAATGVGMNGFSSRIEFAFAPSDPTRVYAMQPNNGGRVWKSTDSGQTFTQATTSGSTGASWYCNGIWVSPTDPNFLVLTGLYVYKSTDGGATITTIGQGYITTEQPHPDAHTITMDPGFDGVNNKRVYVGTDGGFYKTDDITTASTSTGWSWFAPQIRSTQYYGAVGDSVSGRIVGGTQDNGTHFLDRGNVNGALWFGGDGGFCALDPADPNIMYGEYIYAQVFRTTNGGPNADWIFNGSSLGANFIAPFILDPNDSNRLLIGTRSVHVSANAKATTPSFTTVKAADSSPVSAIAVAPGNSNIIFVGHNDGKIFRTTNGTNPSPTWVAVDDNSTANPFPNRQICRITFDPQNANRIWVGLGGFNSDNLFLSTDGGVTWTMKGGADPNRIPSAPIRGIAVHPQNSNKIFVGTEVGLCVSGDGGTTWSAPSEGPANVAIYEANLMYGSTQVLLATHGRGLWVYGPLSLSSLTGPAKIKRSNTATYTVTIDQPASTGGVRVALSSSNSGITVPSGVMIPERQTSATFMATASANASGSTVITTELDGDTKTINVAVETTGIQSFTLLPTTVIGGSTTVCKGTVVLTDPAPTGGLVVTLTSSIPAVASVPASITVGSGQTTKQFVITHTAVATRTIPRIKAAITGSSLTADLTVYPPKPVTVVINPIAFVGGTATTVTGTVTISGPAPAGMKVALVSSYAPAATVPATITMTTGATQGTFTVTHFAQAVKRDFSVKATTGASFARGVATNQPPSPISVTMSPSSVTGGSSQTVTGTVQLNGPAPTGGITVTLTSSNVSAGTVPTSIVIPAGQTTGTFTVSHKAVKVATTVTVTAKTYLSTTGKVTINP